jgi:hypothetical protein
MPPGTSSHVIAGHTSRYRGEDSQIALISENHLAATAALNVSELGRRWRAIGETGAQQTSENLLNRMNVI